MADPKPFPKSYFSFLPTLFSGSDRKFQCFGFDEAKQKRCTKRIRTDAARKCLLSDSALLPADDTLEELVSRLYCEAESDSHSLLAPHHLESWTSEIRNFREEQLGIAYGSYARRDPLSGNDTPSPLPSLSSSPGGLSDCSDGPTTPFFPSRLKLVRSRVKAKSSEPQFPSNPVTRPPNVENVVDLEAERSLNIRDIRSRTQHDIPQWLSLQQESPCPSIQGKRKPKDDILPQLTPPNDCAVETEMVQSDSDDPFTERALLAEDIGGSTIRPSRSQVRIRNSTGCDQGASEQSHILYEHSTPVQEIHPFILHNNFIKRAFRPSTVKKSKYGFVYISQNLGLKDDGIFKVGNSKDPMKRLEELSRKNKTTFILLSDLKRPALMNCDRAERLAHQFMDDYRDPLKPRDDGTKQEGYTEYFRLVKDIIQDVIDLANDLTTVFYDDKNNLIPFWAEALRSYEKCEIPVDEDIRGRIKRWKCWLRDTRDKDERCQEEHRESMLQEPQVIIENSNDRGLADSRTSRPKMLEEVPAASLKESDPRTALPFSCAPPWAIMVVLLFGYANSWRHCHLKNIFALAGLGTFESEMRQAFWYVLGQIVTFIRHKTRDELAGPKLKDSSPEMSQIPRLTVVGRQSIKI